jgi:hypothetical protein
MIRLFNTRLSLLLIFFLFTLFHASAQDIEQKYIKLSGHIYSSDSLEVIPYATIIEKRSKVGTVSDASGHFSIVARPYDTLLVSAIGYSTFQYIVKETVENKVYDKIVLSSRTYQLEEVGVVGYKNFKQFKQDFVDLKLPEENVAYIPPPLPVYSGNSQPTAAVSGPFTKLYDKYSKRGREAKKVVYLRMDNDKKIKALQKYNPDFVMKILGIEEEEADKVIAHCTFTPEYINTTNEYDLALALKSCYTSYKSN